MTSSFNGGHVTLSAATPVFALTMKERKGPGDVCKDVIGPSISLSCPFSLCGAPTSQRSRDVMEDCGGVRVYTESLVASKSTRYAVPSLSSRRVSKIIITSGNMSRETRSLVPDCTSTYVEGGDDDTNIGQACESWNATRHGHVQHYSRGDRQRGVWVSVQW